MYKKDPVELSSKGSGLVGVEGQVVEGDHVGATGALGEDAGDGDHFGADLLTETLHRFDAATGGDDVVEDDDALAAQVSHRLLIQAEVLRVPAVRHALLAKALHDGLEHVGLGALARDLVGEVGLFGESENQTAALALRREEDLTAAQGEASGELLDRLAGEGDVAVRLVDRDREFVADLADR